MAKIILNVPDNEFGADIQNKFHDFFGRVKVEIETRVEVGDTLMCGAYEIETAEMFLNAFKEMKIIPDNATNGDVIKAMFPNVNFGTLAQDDVIVNKDYSNNDEPQVFIPIRVWNAPYKSDCIPSEYDLSEDIELSNPQMYR